jgi:hypothetical protein
LDKQQLAILALAFVAAWITWLIFGALRHYVDARNRSSDLDKLLFRLSTPETLSAFLASPAGERFLRALQPNPNDAWRTIIHTTQSAVMFATVGIAIVCCRWLYPESTALLPLGIASFTLATAFGASAAVSVLMHRRAGLLANADQS